MTYTIKQNDIGTQLTFNITDSQGLSLDLTGSTIVCTISGGDIQTEITKACIIDDASAGTCYCVLSSDDTAIAGSYAVEVNIDYGGSSFTTVDKVRLKILSVL